MTIGVKGLYSISKSGVAFWVMHSGLVATGAEAMGVFALLFRTILAPTAEPVPSAG